MVAKRRELASKTLEEEEDTVRTKMDIFQPSLAKCFTGSLCGVVIIKIRTTVYH